MLINSWLLPAPTRTNALNNSVQKKKINQSISHGREGKIKKWSISAKFDQVSDFFLLAFWILPANTATMYTSSHDDQRSIPCQQDMRPLNYPSKVTAIKYRIYQQFNHANYQPPKDRWFAIYYTHIFKINNSNQCLKCNSNFTSILPLWNIYIKTFSFLSIQILEAFYLVCHIDCIVFIINVFYSVWQISLSYKLKSLWSIIRMECNLVSNWWISLWFSDYKKKLLSSYDDCQSLHFL